MATATAPNWNQEPHSRLRTGFDGRPLGNGMGSALMGMLMQAPGQHLPRVASGKTSTPRTRALLEEATP